MSPLAQTFSIAQTQTQRQTLAQMMAMRLSPVLEMSQQQVHDRILQEIETNPVVEAVDLAGTESFDGMREAFDAANRPDVPPAPEADASGAADAAAESASAT